MGDFLLAIYPHLRALWVVWFLVVFVVMLVWVLRPSRRARYEAAGRIPFHEEPPQASAAHAGPGARRRPAAGRR